MMLLKRIMPALLICCAFLNASSQDKATDYVRQYRDLAIREMIRTGVPAAITLAQGILESQSGESNLAKSSNNHFGIKCKTDWTGEKVYHDDDARGECFRKYNDAEQSYVDHSDFLRSRPHYAFLFTLDPTDYEGWAKGLKKAGYATSPTYAQRLIDLIQRYNLQEFTLIALQKTKQGEKELLAEKNDSETQTTVLEFASASPTDTIKQASTLSYAAETTNTEVKAEVEPASTKIISAVYKASDYPESTFTINGTRVIFAKEGTSILALANAFGISYKKLLEFNELDEKMTGDILGYDQLIFLGKKSKKGSKDHHIVAADETLEIIAQKEGVLLESILAYNRIPKGRQPMPGEKIYLKANSPVTPKLVASSANN